MLKLTTKRIGFVGRTVVERRCSTFSQSDRDMQLNFDMIGNRVMTALQLVEGTERKKFLKLQNDKIIRTDNNLMAVWMYVQLQNPLLERYHVDVSEIIKGATYGFDCAYRAISSKDLSDYAVGEIDSSISNDLLKDTMNTTLYTAFLNASKDLRAKGIDSNLTDLCINSVTLTNIHTEIVPGDVEEGTEYMSDREREVFSEMKNTMPWLQKFTSTDSSRADTTSTDSTDAKKSIATDKAASKVVSSEKDAQPVNSVASTPTASSAPAAGPTSAPPTAPTASSPTPVSLTPSEEDAQIYRAQPATRAALRAARASSSRASVTPSASTPAPASPTVPTAEIATVAANTTETSTVNDSHTDEEPATAEAKPIEEERELSAYPPGSVLASVEVRFDIQEEFETKLRPTKKEKVTSDVSEEEEQEVDMLSTVKNARKSSVHWTFRGCISGQVPLSWTVVAFNGMGARNSKY